MNRDDIIRLRQEADDWAKQKLQCVGEFHPDFHDVSDERFAALVAAAEREACAQMVEEHAKNIHGYDKHFYAYAIRARGEAQPSAPELIPGVMQALDELTIWKK